MAVSLSPAPACFLSAPVGNLLQRMFLGLLEPLASSESWEFTSPMGDPALGAGRGRKPQLSCLKSGAVYTPELPQDPAEPAGPWVGISSCPRPTSLPGSPGNTFLINHMGNLTYDKVLLPKVRREKILDSQKQQSSTITTQTCLPRFPVLSSLPDRLLVLLSVLGLNPGFATV